MRITGRQVCAVVCGHYNIAHSVFVGSKRTRAIARPRQIAVYLMRRHCSHLSYPDIGRLIGGRDHTTMLHGYRKVCALIAENPDFAREVWAVEAKVICPKANPVLAAQIIAAERHVEHLRQLEVLECGRAA